MKKKILRITTISESLNILLKGQLGFLNQYFEVVGVADGEELLAKVSEREGIRTVHIPIKREISIFNDLKSLISLIRLIKTEKPYIVHANTPKGSLLGLIAAWYCGVPVRIYTVTGLRFETTAGNFRRLLIFMEKICCHCSTHIIPEGDGVKQTLLKNNITAKPINKILNGSINGIDLDFFNVNLISDQERFILWSKYKISLDDFVFVFVGRLVNDKGINELVEAFLKLKELTNSKSLKLLLVGPFEEKLDPLLPSTIRIISENDAIISVGFQSDVRPFFAISSCLVFPSYREGFPNVVLQAGAMGLPSIVTDINGCNEIIVNGENGIIVPKKNVERLYEAMKFYYENSMSLENSSKIARAMIESRYNQPKVWDALLQNYNSIINE